MNFHGRQCQLLSYFSICNLLSVFQLAALDPFGQQGTRRDRRAAPIGFKFSVFDHAVVINLNLQAHDITAGRRSNHASTYALVLVIKLSYVPGILVMIDYLFTISHDALLLMLQCCCDY